MQSTGRGERGDGNKTFLGRPVAGDRAMIMAIVNRTPDSFYDRGATFTDEAAMEAAHRKIADGADVIDIGGVITTPAAKQAVPEQDARQLARRQKHNAGCFSRDELVALAFASEALEVRESIVDRASRYLRELLEGRR